MGEDTLSKQLFNYIMTTDDDGNEVRVLQSKGSYPYFVKDQANKIFAISNSGTETVGMATFFRHYWISKYKRCNANVLYDSFNKTIAKSKEKYKAFLRNLVNNAKNYVKAINPSREDYDNRKEYFWLVQSLSIMNKTFNVVQTRIVLLALYDVKERNLILLEQELNREAGEKDYLDKLYYYKKSKYDWIQEFVKENDIWSEEKI